MTHPAVPLGGEDMATVLKNVGTPREFEFEVRDHVTIAESLDLVDFESASEVRLGTWNIQQLPQALLTCTEGILF
jgi:seryl-tRNA synthetase